MKPELNSAVYLKPHHVKAIVKVIDEFNQKIKLTYFIKETRHSGWFTLDQLDEWKVKTKSEIEQHKENKRDPLEIKIKYFDSNMPRLEKTIKGDWIDLRSAENVELKNGDFKLIPLGVAMELPRGYEADVKPRSSTYKNFRVIQTNAVGTVDELYKGDNDQWFMPVIAMEDTVINKYDRVCQFRIQRKMPTVKLTEVSKLNNPDRQGHGSTGTK